MGCNVRARRCSNRRRAVVRGNPLLGVIVGRPRMLSLSGYGRNMPIMSGRFFLRRGPFVDPAVTSIVANMVRVLVHPRVVNVVDDALVHMIHGRVVEKMPVLPAPAFITMAEVTEAIVDPAIETYGRAPVAIIENESATAPTPIARSPEKPGFRSQYPCARHPIIFSVPCPIPWRPDITVAGANRLIVNGQLGWRDRN